MRLNLGDNGNRQPGRQNRTTLLISHPACLEHNMGEGHPERPDRVRAIERALEGEAFQMLARDVAPRADGRRDRARPSAGLHRGDPRGRAQNRPGRARRRHVDVVRHLRGRAARRGGAVFAVDEVMGGKVRNAFVSTRPPGHHAEVATPMGFCFFNNTAIAARHAQKAHGAERVAIMDFDVHHGNGVQHIFWDDPTVMYASTHQMPHYPGTGAR